MTLYKKNILVLVVICLAHQCLHAQNCDSNYFSFLYNSSDYNTYSKTIVTPDNSLLCLQTNRLYYHGITKFTPQGNIIFSYGYTAPFSANGNHAWTELRFRDMAVSAESTTYTGGSVTKRGVFSDNTEIPPARTAGVINKIDKYGKVLWSRFFANATTDPLEFSNVITLNNNDIVSYLTTQIELPFYGRVACLSANGDIKWLVTLNTGEYSSGYLGTTKERTMMQTKNGNIILADVIYKYYDSVRSRRLYHFIDLNASDGSVIWEKSYDYNDGSFIPNIVSAYELPNGDISFQTTTDAATALNASGYSKALNIIISSTGDLKKLITTHEANNPMIVTDAKPDGNAGNQSLLMITSDGKPALIQTDKDGNVLRSYKYGKLDNNMPPVSFAKIENGYDIFLSDFSQSFRMLRTDPIGRLDCDSMSINVVQETIPLFGVDNNIHTQNVPAPTQSGYSTGFFISQNTEIPTIQRSTVCQKNIPCCIDVVDTTNINNVSLCEGSTYTLPDGAVIKDSGRYYVSVKTAKGCDSVSLYQVTVYKNPSALMLGLDTCFDESDSIVIHATDGYYTYKWNDLQTSSSYYTVHQPGTYSVTVSNICGTKTDNINIFKECEFPVYMPNAFTPNRDRLNDVYRVPATNQNRLIQFTIYNRWGKVVFRTTKLNDGWDGNINSIPQQTGIYIYYLQMQTITGKHINQKGTFMLIR